MILPEHYRMGRELPPYGAEPTPEVAGNTAILLERVNRLPSRAATDGVHAAPDPKTGSLSASGWRPRPVADATLNASGTSEHVIGCAIDVRDAMPNRCLARRCLRNRSVLEEVRLWMEDPQWTPR